MATHVRLGVKLDKAQRRLERATQSEARVVTSIDVIYANVVNMHCNDAQQRDAYRETHGTSACAKIDATRRAERLDERPKRMATTPVVLAKWPSAPTDRAPCNTDVAH